MLKHTQTIRRQKPTNCLSSFDRLSVKLKGLIEWKLIDFAVTKRLLHIYCYLIATTCREIYERAILNRKNFERNVKYIDILKLLSVYKIDCKNIIFRRWEGDKQMIYFWRRPFSKRSNWQNCSSISVCTAGQYEGYDI